MDDALATRWLHQGDTGGFHRLVAGHQDAVFAVAYAVLRNHHFAEEVAQEAFLSLWVKREEFDPARGSLRGLLLRIARNRAIDRVRREEARPESVGEVEHDARDPHASKALSVIEDRTALLSVLDGISKVQRETLILVYIGGMTCPEISAAVDVPLPTVKTRLRDGLRKLRSQQLGAIATESGLQPVAVARSSVGARS